MLTADTVTPRAQAALDVAGLKPGDRVRVKIVHIAEPLVGLVRRSSNSFLDDLVPTLYLDCGAAHILRNHLGQPGRSVASIEVLDKHSLLTRDEKFDLLADMMRTHADLLARRRNVGDGSMLVAARIDRELRECKDEIVELAGGAW